ncbi:hypothetical protein BGY98DRAFT_1098000 [Russula aff. rugulosa BPL654]|nr:hypothetical protein BGY98DRAFT_1098000 [Russula aff. rugulosa BPL654]
MTTFVHGTVCNAEQYNLSQVFGHNDKSGPPISCLTRGESIGLALTAEASLLSSTSVFVIFIWIGWNVRWYRKTFPKGDWKLFQGPADIYMFSLFVFDFLQALGGVLNIRWAHNGIVTTGHYCTAQGIIQQIGEVGVALITLVLSCRPHFRIRLWQVGMYARGVALGMVSLATVFITLWVAIGAGVHRNYEVPTPYWCWISPKFSGIRIGGEYIWLWIALFASAILYIPLYFWAEGRFYPLAYSLMVLPLSISRWLLFGNHDVPSAATFFSVTLYSLSGAINVLLFLIVRPHLLLFPRPERFAEPDMEIAPQDTGPTGPAMFFDITKFQQSPELTSAALPVDEGSENSAAQSRVSSRRISDDI